MNDTKILQIIKNNIIFIVVFSVFLLLYIIYLCYQIYKDSKKVKVPYISKCPDYWTIDSEEVDGCVAPDFITPKPTIPLGLFKKCTSKNKNQCINFGDSGGNIHQSLNTNKKH